MGKKLTTVLEIDDNELSAKITTVDSATKVAVEYGEREGDRRYARGEPPMIFSFVGTPAQAKRVITFMESVLKECPGQS